MTIQCRAARLDGRLPLFWALLLPHELGLHVHAGVGLTVTHEMMLFTERSRENLLAGLKKTEGFHQVLEDVEGMHSVYLAEVEALENPFRAGEGLYAIRSLELVDAATFEGESAVQG